jgi:hypothetical protein
MITLRSKSDSFVEGGYLRYSRCAAPTLLYKIQLNGILAKIKPESRVPDKSVQVLTNRLKNQAVGTKPDDSNTCLLYFSWYLLENPMHRPFNFMRVGASESSNCNHVILISCDIFASDGSPLRSLVDQWT